MRKLAVGIAILILAFYAGMGYAAGNIRIVVDGRELTPDVPAQNVNGRVMVPIRFVAEALGANVEWDGTNNTVLITTKAPQQSAGKTATVKGVVTYAGYYGQTPDTSSRVFLFPLDYEPNPKYDLNAVFEYTHGLKLLEGFYFARVDADGRYEIADVKPGRYAVLISPEHARGKFRQWEEMYRDIGIFDQYFETADVELLIFGDFIKDNCYRFWPSVTLEGGRTYEFSSRF